MRIAHVTATFHPYCGGTGNVAYYNARELARRGHEVHVFTARVKGTLAEETLEGVSVHRLRPLFRIGNAPFLPGLLNLKKFDLIHLHYPFFGGELTALAACLTHTPLIVTYHQDVHLQGIIGSIERFLRYTIGKATLRSAQRVLFTTQDYGQNSYIRPLLHGRENHIGELPNGVDPKHFCPGHLVTLVTQKYRLSDEDKIVLLVARLDRAHFFKGIPIFLQALAQLPESAKAVIVGEGDLMVEYAKLARSLSIQNRVFFSGRVSPEVLPQYYRMANVTVLPSTTMGEAFGLVLVESLACGTPVIASNLPGVRTVVSDGQDGFLIEPNNPADLAEKLGTLLSLPPDERLAMGARGRAKVVDRYTWEKVSAQLEHVYQQSLTANNV